MKLSHDVHMGATAHFRERFSAMSSKPILLASAALLASLTLAGCGGQQTASRDNVRAVGSSTVLPFAKAVAEEMAKATGMPAPIVESTGTGAGMKLFCAGVGVQHPDIENASRRMKKSEFEDCVKNGVKDIVEIQVGLDGIAASSTFSLQISGANGRGPLEPIFDRCAMIITGTWMYDPR